MSNLIQRHLDRGKQFLLIELVSGTAVLSRGHEIVRVSTRNQMAQFAAVDLQEIFSPAVCQDILNFSARVVVTRPRRTKN